MKGFDKTMADFMRWSRTRPPYYSVIELRRELCFAHLYGTDIGKLMESYRILEGSTRKQDRLRLTIAVCKDYFRDFMDGCRFSLLSGGLLKAAPEASNADGTTTPGRPAAVQINAPTKAKDYFFRTMNGWEFFREVVNDKMFIDPNGILVAIPGGPGLASISTTVDVAIWYIPFSDISYIGPEEVVFKKDRFQYYVNREEYRRFSIAKGKPLADTWYYPHSTGKKMWIQLGGDISDFTVKTGEEDFNESGDQFYFYDSFIWPVMELATRVVRADSDVELLKQAYVNPIIIMDRTPCQGCAGMGCKGNEEAFAKSCQCSDKSGTVPINFAPGMVFFRKEARFKGEEQPAGDPIMFITPPIEAVQFHAEELQKNMMRVKEGLQMYRIDQSQSGVAKEIDEMPRQIKVAKIAGRLYELMRVCIDWVAMLQKDPGETTIVLPDNWLSPTRSHPVAPVVAPVIAKPS